MTAVEVRDVRHGFDNVEALRSVSLDVPEGSFTVFLGPSGSGKTTLLNLIGGFHEVQNGTIRIGGEDMAGVPPAQRPTATVFQDYALFPHMSVAKNVGFGLRMAGRPAAERRERVAQMLEMVGLPEAARRRPHQLSGGQRQRIALARALAVSPKVLLLDEPLGALDLALRRQMQAELSRIQTQVGATFIHVTHDQDEALALADQLVVMSEGRIQDVGSPQTVYDSPRTAFTAAFVGRSNMIKGQITTVCDGVVSISTPAGKLQGRDTSGALREGGEGVIMLRPEHIIPLDAAPPGAIALPAANLRAVTFAGAHRDGDLVLPDGTALLAQFPAAMPLSEGAIAVGYVRESAVILPAGAPAP